MYSYYTWGTRHRYGTNECGADRLPADELEQAILDQHASLLEHEPLVRQAIDEAFATLEADRPRSKAELARVDQRHPPRERHA